MTTVETNVSARANAFSAGANRIWAPTWTADYEEAERLSCTTGKGILFLFTSNDLTREDSLRDFLGHPEARGAAAGYIPALIFQKNERDRRYAAQFGVNR